MFFSYLSSKGVFIRSSVVLRVGLRIKIFLLSIWDWLDVIAMLWADDAGGVGGGGWFILIDVWHDDTFTFDLLLDFCNRWFGSTSNGNRCGGGGGGEDKEDKVCGGLLLGICVGGGGGSGGDCDEEDFFVVWVLFSANFSRKITWLY